MTGRRGRRGKHLLDDLKEKIRYCKLKEEAVDHTLWRIRFGRGCGPAVKTWGKEERCSLVQIQQSFTGYDTLLTLLPGLATNCDNRLHQYISSTFFLRKKIDTDTLLCATTIGWHFLSRSYLLLT